MTRPVDVLYDIPLDAVPRRSTYELLMIVAPIHPGWIRRNHTLIEMGLEEEDAVSYSLYCSHHDPDDRYPRLWRILVQPNPYGEGFDAALLVWAPDPEQTRMEVPWLIVEKSTTALALSRTAVVRGLLATVPAKASTRPALPTTTDEVRSRSDVIRLSSL